MQVLSFSAPPDFYPAAVRFQEIFGLFFLDFSWSFSEIKLGLQVMFWTTAAVAYLWIALGSILLLVGFFLDPLKSQARVSKIPAVGLLVNILGNALFIPILANFFAWANCTQREVDGGAVLTMDLLPSVVCWEGLHQVHCAGAGVTQPSSYTVGVRHHWPHFGLVDDGDINRNCAFLLGGLVR
jgi:hypothetical protein